MVDRIEVRIRGLERVQRSADDLPQEVRTQLRLRRRLLAQRFARIVAAAGRADTRQSARAASTVKALTAGGEIKVVAGPHPMLYGSEFGILRRTGWYAARRYLDSPARQYRPHRGSSSYWFRKAVRENQAVIDEEWAQASDAIIRAWGG